MQSNRQVPYKQKKPLQAEETTASRGAHQAQTTQYCDSMLTLHCVLLQLSTAALEHLLPMPMQGQQVAPQSKAVTDMACTAPSITVGAVWLCALTTQGYLDWVNHP
jgi:hypothetical protein